MIFGKKEKKAHGASSVMGMPWQSGRKIKPKDAITDGYQTNPIVYKCSNIISTAIAGLEVELKDKNGDVITNNPILDLLKKPNPSQGGDTFIKAAFTDFLVNGEMFIDVVKAGARPVELWQKSPTKMEVKPGVVGLPLAYKLKKENGREIVWPVDQLTGRSDMFHLKMYNPLDKWRGQTPLMAGSLSVDSHNSGVLWNYSLLKNSARPSGLIKFEGEPSEETRSRLTEWFKKRFQGASNAGEIPMLTDGADWISMDQSPRDMDFNKTLDKGTLYIAGVYCVPLPLVDNSSSTFNNMETAKELLYTDTVIPMFNAFLEQFNMWLEPYLNGATLVLNMDNIPALERLRKTKFESLGKAVKDSLITIDEARKELGFEEIGGVAAGLLIPVGMVPIEMAGLTMTEPNDQLVKDLRLAGFEEKDIALILASDNEK